MKPITEQSAKGGTAAPAGKISSDTQPISEQTLTNQEIIDSYDYLSSAASAWDCTGLIPSAPSSSAELESYEAVYPFEPPKLDSNESGATKYSSAYTGEKQE
ncbi:hypothetical protein HMPREF0987_00785 [Lachnospiraceae bacterium 9_1_43BFAA]|nr:hypothetical protein HMPREF0987_00785 [Lachnospiraceae bacterium 9_1_43BFAA]